MVDCNKCMHTGCDSRSDSVTACFSFRSSVDVPEAIPPMDQIEEEHRLRMIEAGKHFVPTQVSIGAEGVSLGGYMKPEDLVPTMKLRLLQSARDENNPPILQQWFDDRSKMNAAGLPESGRWINVPVETE